MSSTSASSPTTPPAWFTECLASYTQRHLEKGSTYGGTAVTTEKLNHHHPQLHSSTTGGGGGGDISSRANYPGDITRFDVIFEVAYHGAKFCGFQSQRQSGAGWAGILHKQQQQQQQQEQQKLSVVQQEQAHSAPPSSSLSLSSSSSASASTTTATTRASLKKKKSKNFRTVEDVLCAALSEAVQCAKTQYMTKNGHDHLSIIESNTDDGAAAPEEDEKAGGSVNNNNNNSSTLLPPPTTENSVTSSSSSVFTLLSSSRLDADVCSHGLLVRTSFPFSLVVPPPQNHLSVSSSSSSSSSFPLLDDVTHEKSSNNSNITTSTTVTSPHETNCSRMFQSPEHMRQVLNTCHLPSDVWIRRLRWYRPSQIKLKEASTMFQGKQYSYYIRTGNYNATSFVNDVSHYFGRCPLNATAMATALQDIIGSHDFVRFSLQQKPRMVDRSKRKWSDRNVITTRAMAIDTNDGTYEKNVDQAKPSGNIDDGKNDDDEGSSTTPSNVIDPTQSSSSSSHRQKSTVRTISIAQVSVITADEARFILGKDAPSKDAGNVIQPLPPSNIADTPSSSSSAAAAVPFILPISRFRKDATAEEQAAESMKPVMIRILIVGSGFLRYQVRQLCHAAVMIGSGELPITYFRDMLAATKAATAASSFTTTTTSSSSSSSHAVAVTHMRNVAPSLSASVKIPLSHALKLPGRGLRLEQSLVHETFWSDEAWCNASIEYCNDWNIPLESQHFLPAKHSVLHRGSKLGTGGDDDEDEEEFYNDEEDGDEGEDGGGDDEEDEEDDDVRQQGAFSKPQGPGKRNRTAISND